jgi:hypothetical protein
MRPIHPLEPHPEGRDTDHVGDFDYVDEYKSGSWTGLIALGVFILVLIALLIWAA